MVPSFPCSGLGLWGTGLSHVLTHLENPCPSSWGLCLGQSRGTNEETSPVSLGLAQSGISQAATGLCGLPMMVLTVKLCHPPLPGG